MNKIKTLVFGSLHSGYSLLFELLKGDLSSYVDVRGVISDDLHQTCLDSPERKWQYGFTPEEERMVIDLALRHNIDVYTGNVNTANFLNQYKMWNPELCFSACFGQIFNEELFSHPEYGFYNFHPSGETWPSYRGPQPFEGIMNDRLDHFYISAHVVDAKPDNGLRIARSRNIPIMPNMDIDGLNKIASQHVGELTRDIVLSIAKKKLNPFI
ncbi:formyltransferase family protein [Winogradskyella sp. 3972H.M.0a.05]|uniref:formyltransferase family protein n=1 Tax=Winogradskyella sp. 3972H.M.0a.05 TaxID=2950277 RepID=UPI0033919704